MVQSVQLPKAGGSLYTYSPGKSGAFDLPKGVKLQSRIAFSAAHVVCDPFAGSDPLRASQIDWNATLAYRHHLWSLGLGVAEAMDTAQRGMGLDWQAA